MKKNPTILIIEDDTALNDAYKTILETASYSAFTAFNGEEALEVAAKHKPDLIFLDLRMPGMDGIGFLKAYQPKKNNPEAHIIVFSNYDMQAEVDEAYELGAERYVLKALAAPNDLLKIVRDLI
ncbi:MAG: response regulator [Candidatus Microsaccharimonas sp.]